MNNEEVIEAYTHVFRNNLQIMVKEGFEGWKGEIRMFGYTLELDMTIKERPGD